MRLHKHRFVRAISAFSITALTVILVGALAPKVRAETVSGLETVSSNFGENNQQTILSEYMELLIVKRDFRDTLVQRISNLHQNMPALENSLRQLDQEIDLLEKEVLVLQAEAEHDERQRSLTAIEAWCVAHDAEYEAVECAAFSMYDRFEWPAPGFSLITSEFGNGHRGIDISGYEIFGKPIAAAKRGTVTYSGWMGSYGYCVFIDHGDGFSTRYAHASELTCAEGDIVLPGETIAYVGSTGYSTGPHLHFEILYDGVLQDPSIYY